MKYAILQISFFVCMSVHAQDYFEYQRVFNRIDADISHGKHEAAIKRLDSIYEQYDFMYARHCIKALQICCKVNDSARAGKFLEKCFKQGVPLWVIRVNELTRECLKYTSTRRTIVAYDSLRAIYYASINMGIARQIDSLLERDQRFTKKVNNAFYPFGITSYVRWRRNNTREFEKIRQIIEVHGFPGERLIGLPSYLEDSAKAASNIIFYGPYLFDSRTFTMLLHCYSHPREGMDALLFKSTMNGYLPPYQYASLNDFRAEFGKLKADTLYYNAWHHAPGKTPMEQINKRRDRIGLNSFAVQENNTLINRERRKKNSANSEIITE